jgi:mRNA-degrading endonuclease YafQ of YafQ-DinJ toxin-antitoxin module
LQLKDLDYIFSWVNEMERFGPIFIESQTSWNDHPLVNKRAGQHSSSFSESGRIIYRIHKNRIIVLKITTTHDYS